MPCSHSSLCLGHPSSGPHQHLHGACSEPPKEVRSCSPLMPGESCTSPSKTLLHSLASPVGSSLVRMTSDSPIQVTSDSLMATSRGQFSVLCSLDLLVHFTHVSLDPGTVFSPDSCLTAAPSCIAALPPPLPAFWMLAFLRQALDPPFLLTSPYTESSALEELARAAHLCQLCLHTSLPACLKGVLAGNRSQLGRFKIRLQNSVPRVSWSLWRWVCLRGHQSWRDITLAPQNSLDRRGNWVETALPHSPPTL